MHRSSTPNFPKRYPQEKKDHMKTLAAHAWALIPLNMSHGDDSSIMWVVVGYFQGSMPQRVIGESWDEDNPQLAIEDALKTIKGNSYAYKYEYKGDY